MQVIKRAKTAIGRLMKKIHDQPKWVAMMPPSTGPAARPSIEIPM